MFYPKLAAGRQQTLTTEAFGGYDHNLELADGEFYDMENLVKKINDMNMIGFGIRIVMVYLVFLAAYLMITYIIYNRRYTKGRKQVKEYYNRLKRVSSLYREEENISNTDDWEV